MATMIVGCGYLGTELARALIKRGDRVIGTTRTEEKAEKLRAIGVEAVILDVLDRNSVLSLPSCDRVFYCVGFDRSSGANLRTVYVDGLRNVLDAISHKIKRLVYASSTGVYGQTDGGEVDETSKTDPKTESGKACLEAERLIMDRARGESPMSATILRFAGLYGPQRVIRRKLLEQGEPIVGDPNKWLNVVHIRDAARAALRALESFEAGPMYLVADDRPVARREYYECVSRILGVASPRFVEPKPGALDFSRDESNKRISNDRIKAELGWSPEFSDCTSGLPHALSE